MGRKSSKKQNKTKQNDSSIKEGDFGVERTREYILIQDVYITRVKTAKRKYFLGEAILALERALTVTSTLDNVKKERAERSDQEEVAAANSSTLYSGLIPSDLIPTLELMNLRSRNILNEMKCETDLEITAQFMEGPLLSTGTKRMQKNKMKMKEHMEGGPFTMTCSNPSSGAIPKITVKNKVTCDIINESKEVAKDLEIIAEVSNELRVPPIYEPRHILPKKHNKPAKTIFLGEFLFNGEACEDGTNYETLCMKELYEPEENFIALQPGVFVITMGMTYADDFRVIKGIYPSPSEDQIPKIDRGFYLIEKQVLNYLENFHASALYDIFSHVVQDGNLINGYIKELDYQIAMTSLFHFHFPSEYMEERRYTRKESQSKFCPGRGSNIQKMFHSQLFK